MSPLVPPVPMSWEKQLLEGHSGKVGDLVEKFLNSAREKLLENKEEYEAMAKKAEQLTDELHQCILPSQEDGKKVDKTKIIDNEAEQSEVEKLKAAVQKGFDSRGARGSKPEIQKPKTLGALVCVFQFFLGGRGAKHLLSMKGCEALAFEFWVSYFFQVEFLVS